MTDACWDLLVRRDALDATQVRDTAPPEPDDGEAVLRPDLVGVTANNVTYAVFGDAMGYWQFFPAPEGFGRVPLWGFADVVASRASGVEVGTRVYGYLPGSSHLVVRPGRTGPEGFADTAEHRAALPAVYNRYLATDTDPAYEPEREALQVLYRPVFTTSWLIDDWLDAEAFHGADAVVLSSASSRTAYGTAFLLHRRTDRPRVVGLTSARNVAFTRGLGCYDDVLAYEDVSDLRSDPSVYVDMAGSAALRTAVHEHLGDALRHDAVVGAARHGEGGSTGPLPGPRPEFFFAPDRVRTRLADWGPAEFAERYAEAWRAFLPLVERETDVVEGTGPQALADVWDEVLGGRTPPRTGHVLRL